MKKEIEEKTGQTDSNSIKYVPTPIMDHSRWLELDRLDKAHSSDQERDKAKLNSKV